MNGCSYVKIIQEEIRMPRKVYIIENLDCANSKYNISYSGAISIEVCHSERSETESRNLRTPSIYAGSLVPRSFDSLCSLRMTTSFVVYWLYMHTKRDNHNDNLYKNTRNHWVPGMENYSNIGLIFCR